jgi:hypothetical protein
MASQHILSGPEISLTVPDISLGRHLYERLVSNGDAVGMVGVTLQIIVLFIFLNNEMLTDFPHSVIMRISM